MSNHLGAAPVTVETVQPPRQRPSRAEIERSIREPRPKPPSPEERAREKLKAQAKAWPAMRAAQKSARIEAATRQRTELQRLLGVILGDAPIEDRDTYAIAWFARQFAIAIAEGEFKREEQELKRPRYVEHCKDSHRPHPDRICIVYEPEYNPDYPQTFAVNFDGVEYRIFAGPNWVDASIPISEIERLLKKRIADEEITIIPPGGSPPEVSKYLKIAREKALAAHQFEP